MVVGVVDEEVEVAGEAEVEVEVEGFLEVLAAHQGLNLGMTMLHMRRCQGRMHVEGVHVAVVVDEDVELLGLGKHLRSEPDQFLRQICWGALACLATQSLPLLSLHEALVLMSGAWKPEYHILKVMRTILDPSLID